MLTAHFVLWVLFTSAMGLYVAGTATSWIVFDDGSTNVKSTFFQTCTTPNGGSMSCVTIPDQTCSDLQMTIQAGKSFGIITCVLGGFVAFVSLWRLWQECIVSGVFRYPFLILVLVSVITATLQWIISFAAYGQSFCGTKFRDNQNYTAGPQGPLFFVGFFLAFIGFFFEICYGAPEPEQTPNSPTEDKTTKDAAPAPEPTTGVAVTATVATGGADVNVTVAVKAE